jgi:hypothetical protein
MLSGRLSMCGPNGGVWLGQRYRGPDRHQRVFEWRLGTRRRRETRARARGGGRQDQRRGKLVSLIGGEGASRERIAAVLAVERPLNDDHFVGVHG